MKTKLIIALAVLTALVVVRLSTITRNTEKQSTAYVEEKAEAVTVLQQAPPRENVFVVAPTTPLPPIPPQNVAETVQPVAAPQELEIPVTFTPFPESLKTPERLTAIRRFDKAREEAGKYQAVFNQPAAPPPTLPENPSDADVAAFDKAALKSVDELTEWGAKIRQSLPDVETANFEVAKERRALYEFLGDDAWTDYLRWDKAERLAKLFAGSPLADDARQKLAVSLADQWVKGQQLETVEATVASSVGPSYSDMKRRFTMAWNVKP